MQSLCVTTSLRFVLIVLLAVAGLASAATQPTREQATVVRVIDGDTVEVRVGDGVEKLRLIGLDTPETVDPRRAPECFGREASAKAKQLLPRGLRVDLEADPTQANRDRYLRLLGYIWLPDGRNFAEVMIREGYGFEYTYNLPYKYMAEFQAAQREAREQGRGLWSPATCGGDTTQPAKDQAGATPGSALADAAAPCEPGQIKGNRNSRIYHVPGQQHYGRTRANVACFDSEGEAEGAGFRKARR